MQLEFRNKKKNESKILNFSLSANNKYWHLMGFPGGSVSACNAGDEGFIPGLGRSPGEGNGNHSSIPAWKVPWTEEPGGLQSMGSQRVGHN